MALPGKLFPERHQHFAAIELGPAYIRVWGRDYCDQQDHLKLCDRHFLKNRAREFMYCAELYELYSV